MTTTLTNPLTLDLDLATKLVQRETPYVVQVHNRKGGCGKSCACGTIAEHMVRELLRVLPAEMHDLVEILLIDLDPQADLTRRLGVVVNDGDETVVDVLKHSPRGLPDNVDVDLLGLAEHAIKPCGWDDPIAKHIWVLPGHEDIEDELLGNSTRNMSFTRLRNALHGWTRNRIRIVLIDCPPALHHLSQLAMAAADGVLLVTNAERDSVRALDAFFANLLGLRGELCNPGLEVIGVLATNVEMNTGLHRDYVGLLAEDYGDDFWGAIPHRSTVAKAISLGVPVLDYTLNVRGNLRAHTAIADPINRTVIEILKRAAA